MTWMLLRGAKRMISNAREKSAVVIGGSNGIGLSVARQLISDNYHVNILDICAPDDDYLETGKYSYYPYDMLDSDEDLLLELKNDESVDCLMITAGIGRVADFEYIHKAEIERIMRINAEATIKTIRVFYDRIKSNSPFYCGVMGSIAGLVSSPMFAVYAASKAAVCRFVESVNIELEESGTPNRILNVSPGSVKGTRFNGGENNVSLTRELADQILNYMKNSETLFIPDEEIYGGVIERYRRDAHEFGLSSYRYKKESDRAVNENRVIIGYLSGTFDLFHVGHLNLLKRAKQKCDYLIVGVHPDASHKGKETFIPFDERMQMVGGCKYVDKVVQSSPEDSDAWNLWHFDKLFVGSDYKGTERFARYEEFFNDKNVEIVYFPYTQGTNSTQIRKTVLLKTKDIE